jgi:LPXTG-site transpeptidase (sortase) family protein
MSENQGVIITISIVVLVCLIALVGVGYSLVKTIQSLQFNGSTEALEPDREVTLFESKSNFNFAIPTVEAEKPKQEEVKVEEKQKTDEQTSEEKVNEAYKKTYDFNFAIPDEKKLPQMKSIQIPSIKYNSPIIISNNGDSAIDFGAWFYPSSHPLEGESIFLCHRRFFKSFDPKSCWNLNKVKSGDDLFIKFSDGSQANYKVETVAVAKGTDMNIYNTGTDQKIKLISCAKSNGKIGSADYRIVVIASLISYNK